MKIAFHNRQRKLDLDWADLQADYAALTEGLSQNLLNRPPRWLPKKDLKAIFSRGSLSVAIVSDRTIRQINKDWRSINKATDVLSFPLELTEPPTFALGLPPGLSEMPEDDPNQWIVGEIIISAEKAVAQAEQYGHSARRELAFLFVHGCLHVLGFDHMTKLEEKEMFGRQSEILSLAGFKRDS
ncbi:MAG: rRNA maturation RNase YbeY [Candidatus Melainabacteria bacterium]|nr:rRNA maturation RNase YbeY [Candidatus Melainabacteria bacterium]